MSGTRISIGVGLKYNRPTVFGKGGGYTPEPEPDITDALLLEGGSPLLLEDGNYFRLESVAVQSRSIDKSYWNF